MIDDVDVEIDSGSDFPVDTDSVAAPGVGSDNLPLTALEDDFFLEDESDGTEGVIDDRYFLSTPFEDYSVSEGLLLCIVLAIIIKGFISLVKEGFRWLRW